MMFKNNKIIILLLLGVIFWQFAINKSNPEKTIAKKMIESEKNSHTGYKVFNNYQEVPTKKDEIRSYYSSSDLQKMIYKAKSNDIIVLDKDVYLKFAIFIDKPITIKGDIVSRKILGKEVASMFMTNSDNIKFENLDFYVIDTLFFLQSDSNQNLEPLRKKLSIINSKITLEGKSNNLIRMNNLIIDNVVIKNKTIEKSSDCSLLEYYGKDIKINKSVFMDFNNSCNGSLRFSSLNSAFIENSLFIGFPFGLNGVVSFDKSKDVVLSNNIFLDLNREYRENVMLENAENLQEVDDEDTEILIGSVGISLYETKAKFTSKNIMVTDNIIYSEIPVENMDLAVSIINDEMLNKIILDNYNLKCSSWAKILPIISSDNIIHSFCVN